MKTRGCPAGPALGLAVATAILSAWTLSPGAAARTFRAADIQVEDYPTVQALVYMDQVLRDRSAGRHRLQIFHSRQLGEEKETIEQTRAGAIDINRVNIAPLASLFPTAGVLSMPFLFRSEEHLNAVLAGPIGEEILASFEPSGIIGLAYYDSGMRSIYNDVRPVRSPADLDGLRIRVQQSDVMIDFWKRLGAQPVPLAYGQVLSALETRLIDGAENNWPSYVTTGHYLKARYITETNHTMPPEVLLMSAKSWQELSADERRLFRDAARESSRFMRERWRRWVVDTRAQAVNSGVSIVAEFDRAAFEAAARAVSERHLTDAASRALRDRIQDTP